MSEFWDFFRYVNGWRYSGGWDTMLYHIVPGDVGGTGNARTRIEVWAQHVFDDHYGTHEMRNRTPRHDHEPSRLEDQRISGNPYPFDSKLYWEYQADWYQRRLEAALEKQRRFLSGTKEDLF